jgi:hypothetical protein
MRFSLEIPLVCVTAIAFLTAASDATAVSSIRRRAGVAWLDGHSFLPAVDHRGPEVDAVIALATQSWDDERAMDGIAAREDLAPTLLVGQIACAEERPLCDRIVASSGGDVRRVQQMKQSDNLATIKMQTIVLYFPRGGGDPIEYSTGTRDAEGLVDFIRMQRSSQVRLLLVGDHVVVASR